ncbi:MAG: glycerophosphodiester phosphodiesterase family protein [Spirochaetaceae bacterium]|jgi:glycerophosphoryl diester phosphodiesterase|nr:glycerophosphodiester phosphodiesterase family protein [Spirochaetaceae bacterium]
MTESHIFKGEKAPLIFGHRGCPLLAPENSLSSFKKILEYNVPGVEIDVQVCKSGELVIFHDDNLKKKTGYDGNIVDTDISRIRSLDCGSHFSEKYKDERIPLLEEVFQLLGDKVYYDIELKADYMKNRNLEIKVFQMIKDFNLEHRVLVSSFNPITLIRFRRYSKTIPLSLIYSNTKKNPPLLRQGKGRFIQKNSGIKPDSRFLDEKLFKKLNRKYDVMTWTVDDEKRFRELEKWGISGICSNRADFFVSGKFIDQD